MLCLSPFQQSVVSLSGSLDIATRDATEAALRRADADVVIVDLTNVQFLDGGALGAFISLKKRLRKAGRLGVVRIVTARPEIRRLFRITGLDKAFDLCDSLQAATA